jgi:hypothetical protein
LQLWLRNGYVMKRFFGLIGVIGILDGWREKSLKYHPGVQADVTGNARSGQAVARRNRVR